MLLQNVVMNSPVTILIFNSPSLECIFRGGITGTKGKQFLLRVMNPPKQCMVVPDSHQQNGVNSVGKGQKCCFDEAPTTISIRETKHLPYPGWLRAICITLSVNCLFFCKSHPFFILNTQHKFAHRNVHNSTTHNPQKTEIAQIHPR